MHNPLETVIIVLNYLLKLLIGSNNDRFLKKCKPLVEKINSLENELSELDDSKIKERFQKLKDKAQKTKDTSSLLVECFALVREASKRTIGLRHYDVQLIGAIALHEGNICEMATGEGKTLTATLPVTLNALNGKGVHVVTVNPYLAQRDAEWMGTVYNFLGLSVGVVIPNMTHEDKKKAYAADITYGSNNEFAFDFLRDNMATALEQKVQRKLVYALIDEVDQIFIEEARTPLIISGPIGKSSEMYATIYPLIDELCTETTTHVAHKKIKSKSIANNLAHLRNAVAKTSPHATINIKEKQVELTEYGHDHIEKLLHEKNILPENENLYDTKNAQLLHYIDACLRAKFILNKDIDYIIHDNEAIIIDEHTGRAMKGRRWSSGHHQAVEAKEKIKIQEENQTLASVTFQNYFRLYEKLAGMTGTADTEAAEFEEIYKLNVIVMPTNKKCIRKEHNDIIYMTKKEKYNAICKEIQKRNANKQPLLVGTTSIEDSEYLSRLLTKHKIKHNILNAKQHAKEAEIIAQAGKPSHVTIATNMAGRGTDIKLGGNLENMLKGIQDPAEIEKITNTWKEQQEVVKNAGGLHVLGTERNESRRVDNQLKGRCSRQGDPGSSQFFLSLEDRLFKIFPQGILNFIKSSNSKPGESLQAGMLTSAIASNQQKMEAHYFDIRKQVLKYDDIANEQRLSVYQQRNDLLELDSIHDEIEAMTASTIKLLIEKNLQDTEENPRELTSNILKQTFRATLPEKEISGITAENIKVLLTEDSKDDIFGKIAKHYFNAYEKETQPVEKEQLNIIEKSLLLQIIDHNWKEHLLTIEDLREGIGFRSYAQKNPEHEYKIEAHALFTDMLQRIKIEYITQLLNIQIQAEPADQKPQKKQSIGNRMLTPFD
ncbi:MAG: preprotein translocase subunit SecA [Pseudomonadota bacterium]|nr:preprotein translocase subunit SecA [Pseudomonadota bacterium]